MVEFCVQDVYQYHLVSDLGMGTEKVTHHPSDVMSQSIRFDADLIGFQPIDNRGGINFLNLILPMVLNCGEHSQPLHFDMLLVWLMLDEQRNTKP